MDLTVGKNVKIRKFKSMLSKNSFDLENEKDIRMVEKMIALYGKENIELVEQ